MEEYDGTPEEITSRFNSGMLINLRLNNLWILTHNFARKGHYSDWSGVLDRIWCELSADIAETKEGEETNKKFNDVEEELSKVGVTNWGKVSGFAEKDSKTKLIMTKQYRLLMQKEIFLRKLQNKQGKGTAYYDESENDWE
tara:strand:- start:1013 stop:1435 length:423 start_codon:yes stop_codon:yes gene_type:complete